MGEFRITLEREGFKLSRVKQIKKMQLCIVR